MLRDFKFLRRNSGKIPSAEEIENVPLNARDSSAAAVTVGEGNTSRAPLNPIQDPAQNPKNPQDRDSGNRTKVERTPTRAKRKASDTSFLARTPEKQGAVSARGRFGWFQKNEPSSNVSEQHERKRVNVDSSLAQPSRGSMTPQPTRSTIGRTNSFNSECNSAQTTPSKSVSKPPNPGFMNGLRNGGTRAAAAALSRGLPLSSCPSTVLNMVEVPHFDLKEDPSFWMDHNVQVLIRIRPLNGMEKTIHGYSRCLKQDSAQSITWVGQPETRFTFDQVAAESIDQETLFRMTGRPMVENCLLGYNSCMFAYGQTGSGKTYTMLGEIEEIEVKPCPNRGLTPRIFEYLFSRIKDEEGSRMDEGLKYNCKCSFLEIYNEQITDLLDPSSTNLLLREDVKKGVYVENLSEVEVRTVGDILRLLAQGSSNRKVAATNMNRESSRSHSVFTCVIESRWEKDSTANLRFARLNLVDLAGSERQKSSGAEGERLREAASINKSLSTLGHVIMVLVDVAHGKIKHVPYRDSRLTFLLQDSLGGNSKTMIIANVSPSVSCMAETLNTLKFAQRAKLIQNNAVVNEDTSGDIAALQYQIRLLKEELSFLKREKVSRSLLYGSTTEEDRSELCENFDSEKHSKTNEIREDDSLASKSKCMMRVSLKQLKSLETTLAGAFRREQMAETTTKQLEAQVEHLNRLARQREEDNRCTKMMLKFREDKIQRMESLLGGSLPSDTYLSEENRALSDEIQLLHAKIDRNPEITRFALENIRLLEQLKRFQDFYEEGEREMLLAEVSQLRNQVLPNLDEVSQNHDRANLTQDVLDITQEGSVQLELKATLEELEHYRSNLQSYVEENTKLNREIQELRHLLNNLDYDQEQKDRDKFGKNLVLKFQPSECHVSEAFQKIRDEKDHEAQIGTNEEVVHLQLELDILKIILKEEQSASRDVEEKAMCLNRDLDTAKEKVLLINKEFEDVNCELQETKSILEALESEQIILINEIENLQNSNKNYVNLLSQKDDEVIALKERLKCQKLQDQPPLKHPQREESSLHAKLKGMQESLEKAKKLNIWYQSDRIFCASDEAEMDEVRKQVEAETAEVIVSLQEELASLQQQVQDSSLKETESLDCQKSLETELKEVREKLHLMSTDNQMLGNLLKDKDDEIRALSEEWEQLADDINEVLADGQEALEEASDQLNVISCSQKRTWIFERFTNMTQLISERESLIQELTQSMENMRSSKNDVDSMLMSLKGATMVITEAHQQECRQKERDILRLSSELNEKISIIKDLESKHKWREDCMAKSSLCATAAFVIVNRLWETNADNLKALKRKEIQLSDMNVTKDNLLHDQTQVIEEAKKQIQNLTLQVELLEVTCADLRAELCKEQKSTSDVERKRQYAEDSDTVHTKRTLQSIGERGYRIQDEMIRLHNGEEDISMIEKQRRENMTAVVAQALAFEQSMNRLEKLFGLKMGAMANRLQSVENTVLEVGKNWCQLEEVFELEVGEAKMVAAQKVAEASCILVKFEENQETIQEADLMINKLLRANGKMKIEIEALKKLNFNLVDERDTLISVVQSLQSANNLKDQQFEELENQLVTNMTDTRDLVLELENILEQVKVGFEKDLVSISGESLCMKSQLLQFTRSMRSWLEDIWSDVIVKDCAISALHLCHMGILLETVTGLNAENAFLHNDLYESNSVIADLRERNVKSRKDLEKCRIIKGKLLSDIKHGFDCISRKGDQTNELGLKVNSFEKKITDLQLQEELMLQRSNYMGSQLSILVKEFYQTDAKFLESILNQEKMLKDQEEFYKCATEFYMADSLYNEFMSLIMASELEDMALKYAEKKRENILFTAVLEDLREELIFVNIDLGLKERFLVDKEDEISLLHGDRQDLLTFIDESHLKIKDIVSVNKVLEDEIQLRISADCASEILKHELGEVAEAKAKLSIDVQNLEVKHGGLVLENSILQGEICLLKASISKLQNDLNMEVAEVSRMTCLEGEKESLAHEVTILKEDLSKKQCEVESTLNHIDALRTDNHNLQNKFISLELSISGLQSDLEKSNTELTQLRHENSVIRENLYLNIFDLDVEVNKEIALLEENSFLKAELNSHLNKKHEVLNMLSLDIVKCVDKVNSLDLVISRMLNKLNEGYSASINKVFEESCENLGRASEIIEEFERLGYSFEELMSENLLLKSEFSRKDDVLRGLSFDLRLLQESASNAKDQKDEFENMAASFETLEEELAIKSGELDEAVAHNDLLEMQLQEKIDTIAALTLEITNRQESTDLLSSEILKLRARSENAFAAKLSIEKELTETNKIRSNLQTDLIEMSNSLEQMNNSVQSLNSNLSAVISERDHLQVDMLFFKNELDKERANSEAKEAILLETRQMAETKRIYAEEKDEEVRLLERSVEELECTVDVLENKVDIIKGEAERQRLQREELELELHSVKCQLENVESSDVDIKRLLFEKEDNVQKVCQHVKNLEREIAVRDAQISQCKAYICELQLHAEVQASEYKQKFKALEAMVDQVKPECVSAHVANVSSNKLERSSSRPRGSGSPFKCIGLGLANQMKLEKDEELATGRLRIEELEALAASRQKEIFRLNTRLASAESMTHDVIRDLLGIKSDMTNYASLLDDHQRQKMRDQALFHRADAEAQEQEVNRLKHQLNELIMERQGWLEEINRKQVDMVALQVSLEKLHQKDRKLTAENEMCKAENANHKKKVMELESTLSKLSGQQNLQQRIHHHAKIKEENNLLKINNEGLRGKMQKIEANLSRVTEELAHYRAARGKFPYVNYDKEERLNSTLKETEEERLQVAEKLLGLCNSILKAAGISKVAHDVNLPVAEAALEQLKNKITSLERELHDLKFKDKIACEQKRQAELMPHPSLLSSTEGNGHESCKVGSQGQYLSSLDR